MYNKVVENPYKDTGGEDTVALTGVENVYFPAMRDWIREHIEAAARRRVIAANMKENELLADVIEVLELLVKYGYYDDPDDVEDVLRPLLEVLNGFTDVPFSTESQSPLNPYIFINDSVHYIVYMYMYADFPNVWQICLHSPNTSVCNCYTWCRCAAVTV